MFSKEGKELADLLLKYHAAKPKTQTQSQITRQSTILRQSKYSNDYAQFQKLAQTISKQDIKTKQQKSPTNPTDYFAHTHDKRKQRQLFQKPTQQKLQNIQYFKNQGNKSYSNKQYQKASYCYQKALVYFDYTFPDTEKQEKQMRRLQQICHQNMGICMDQLKNKQDSIFHLKQTLKYNNKNIKALYRLAKIFLDSDDFSTSEQYIQKIKSSQLKCNQLQILQQQLQIKKKNYSQRLKKISQIMISG